MRKCLLLALIAIFITSYTSFAQNTGDRLITGKLLDAQTKEPLIGATVTIKGTKIAAAAGLDGSF
ncbi:MAG: iron complex outerrane recepter protein, partial [Mucilaginibacter sp.]|nr:iron complex outerrane recepter protein [Mucilaginibacter sp.]